MTVLLTGSSGFLGTYFKNRYMDKYLIKTFSFLKDDLKSLHVSDVDVVVHLSALVHQMGGASASEYERVNVTQTLQLALKAKESGVGQFIFMSTVKVYGEETKEIYTENFTCKPEDEYGKSKLRVEKALLELEDENFKVSIIRTPIVYGQDEVVKQRKSGIFLASDDESLSTTKLVELIAKSLDKKVYLVKIPFFELLLKVLKPSFYKRLYRSLEVNNSETKQKLSLTNPFTVEEGIELMLQGER